MVESFVLGFCVVVVTVIIAALYFFRKTNKDGKVEQLEKRIADLQSSLENSNTLIRDRGLALEMKSKEFLDMKFKVLELDRELEKEKTKFDNLLGQKKSEETRVGQISEQIAPFLDAWPYKASNFRFLGSPIDGISFEDDYVVIVEIKTGHAKLSPKQNQVRKLVREGKVKFVEFRIEPDGYKIKEG